MAPLLRLAPHTPYFLPGSFSDSGVGCPGNVSAVPGAGESEPAGHVWLKGDGILDKCFPYCAWEHSSPAYPIKLFCNF